MTRAFVRSGCCGFLLVWGVSCGVPPAPERFERYAAEVDEILRPGADELRIGDARAPERAHYVLPRRSARRLEAPADRAGALDFLATIGCALSEVVAERNSGLGRVLVPARRWAYERRVVDEIERCLPGLEGERAVRLATRGRFSGGPGGGLHVSRDGGDTWEKLNGPANGIGLPQKPVGQGGRGDRAFEPGSGHTRCSRRATGSRGMGQDTENGQVWMSRGRRADLGAASRVNRNAMGRPTLLLARGGEP